ncbi:uncharacterized protein LOC111219198 [Seriola dumerili]|uniref:uncharacterized protein LOC111219198 n=1 Tax=Seriola dumerili TaxID=41447 RepID=UPI000BBE9052|nr:uncharacterized protein LOC111219198 [Seriola dumerili]
MDFVLVYPLILAFFSGGHSYTKVTEQTSNSCYKSCPAGYHKTGNCDNQDGKYKCKECENNTFTDMENKIEKCFRCDVCNRNEVMIKPCSITSNTKCDCIPGYYNAHRDQSSRFCVKCPCQNCQEPLDSPDFKKKCQPCQRTECLSNSECKRKCTPTTVPPPKSTTKSTTHVTTRSNSTLNPVVITLGPETLKNSLWRFLVVMLIFVVLFCFVLLFIWTHRKSCPYWSTNKGVKPHAKDPKLKEHRSHQDSSPTTLTINISEETPMMHLNYSPATPQHPANISPNTLHKGEERKTDARASCLIMSALVQPGVKVSELCEDGDKLLEAGELGRATSLYMSAFRTHATSTVSHMRKLEKSSLIGVISTLEGWLDSHGENQPAEGFNKGLAAVFLSTLCPNNLTATVFKMESLLQSGGHGCEEIFARCTALLEGKRNPPPEGFSRMVLEITRALSCLFAEPHTIKGLKLYLKAYQKNKSEIVTLVKTRQAQHLSKIVKALTVQIMHMHPSLMFDSEWAVTTKENDKLSVEATALMMEFLLAISPGNRKVQELQAVHMFLTGRFGDSAEVYSALLHHGHCQKMSESSTDKSFQDSPERRAWLLTGRAAACFSAGGRTAEACGDLGEAFEIHPATARIYFQKLFTDHGTGVAARNHLRQQAERGLYGYRERVLLRPDLRSTEGVELLDPVITQLRTLCLLEPDGGGRELRVRLADCLLLRGEHKEALSICSQLAATQSQQSYQNTVQVLRGYARLLSDDHKGALEDFQAVIEHNAPHPSSCVRALCGRGLLRMMGCILRKQH